MTWQTAKLGEVCEVVSGATPKTGKAEFWDGDVPWVTPKDLSNLDSKILSDTPRKITRTGFHSCSARMLPVQSVLFSSRAPIGLVAINGIPVCTNQGFKSMVPRNGKVTSDYLYWWLRLNRGRLDKLGRGATFKEVSKKIMEEVEIPLPPLAEQKRIAGLLDAGDALRTKRREALTQLDKLVQSTFLDMFGDPVTNPMGWERASFEEVIMVGPQNGIYKPSKLYGSGVRILRIDGFYDGAVSDLLGLKRVQVSRREIDTYGLSESDIVVNRVNSRSHLGKCALVPALDEPVIFESNMMRLRLDAERMLPRFATEFLQTRYVKNQILNACKDAVNQSSINQSDVKGFQVLVPPLDLQHRFAGIVESVDRQKPRMRAHLAELDALFASLQSRAFSGTL